MKKEWWSVFPGRLKRELRELRRTGVPYKVDRTAFRNGRLDLEIKVRAGTREYRLLAKYPETFPFFRTEVEAPDLSLPLHQNPFSKSLCLIGRRTENWKPSDTLARLISEQFPLLMRAISASDRSATADIEENQGEPVTTFYPFLENSSILVDGRWFIPPGCPGGWVQIGLGVFRSQTVRAAVLEVCDPLRKSIAKAEPSLAALYERKRLWVRWTRHNDFISSQNPAIFFDEIVEKDPLVGPFTAHRSKGAALDITGVLMREEVARGTDENVWIFVLRETAPGRHRGLPRSDRGRTKLVRSQRAGRDEMVVRTPETACLADKTTLVVGLGCIGAPVALELSKAGCGTMMLLDADVVEPGQTVRWPVGLQLVGLSKADGLAKFIGENWPYTRTVALNESVGHVISLDADAVRGADLVLDCSAEEGVQRYLARLCREQSKTLIVASTTPGARGGIVLRFRSEPSEMCFGCWELYQQDGEVPNPPEDSSGHVQPVGCADPTFTGAGFDVTEICLMATRTVAGELGGGAVGAYPRSWWNVAVLSLRRGGAIIPPRWDVLFLKPHPSCGERHS